METPYLSTSHLKAYSSIDYRSESDNNLATGTALPMLNQQKFAEFASTGVFLVTCYVNLVDSDRSLTTGREPTQTTKINAVLVDSTGADVVRDGNPYGVWPSLITHECLSHEHTFSGTIPAVGIRGFEVDSATTVVGASRRTQTQEQSFFLVDARRGDRLFIFRDYVPYTAIAYEMLRLCPALLSPKSVEI